ncbi:hypothetical protein ASE22_25615 [Sphingomonas sp. Root720]|nr:hypothetical protein ASE22_25615 [Sphingomonas sp. Root720]
MSSDGGSAMLADGGRDCLGVALVHGSDLDPFKRREEGGATRITCRQFRRLQLFIHGREFRDEGGSTCGDRFEIFGL